MKSVFGWLLILSLTHWMCSRCGGCFSLLSIQCPLWIPVLHLVSFATLQIHSVFVFFISLTLPYLRENCQGLVDRLVPNCRGEMNRHSSNERCYLGGAEGRNCLYVSRNCVVFDTLTTVHFQKEKRTVVR